MQDRLETIFTKREEFMQLIQDKMSLYPEWPLDLSTKDAQRVCRETMFKGVEEMFEALQHLKNWKPHRQTEIPHVNREEFLEEIVDGFNYFLSLMILIGVDVDEFFEAFDKKDKVIRKRLDNGY